MSIGNIKDQGNKGNNFPYQLRSLQLLGGILSQIMNLTNSLQLILDYRSDTVPVVTGPNTITYTAMSTTDLQVNITSGIGGTVSNITTTSFDYDALGNGNITYLVVKTR